MTTAISHPTLTTTDKSTNGKVNSNADYWAQADNIDTDEPELDANASYWAQAEHLDEPDEEELALLKLETQRVRRAHCGGYFNRYFHVETGKLVAGKSECKLWRGKFCLVCFEERKEYLLSRAHDAVLEARHNKGKHLIRKIEINQKEGNKLARKLDKSDYVRFPTEDYDLFLIDDLNFTDGEEITYNEMAELDWDKLTNTAEGRNISGHLGKVQNSNDDDDTFTITTKSFTLHMETTKEQQRAALEAVVEKTGHLTPTTPEEIQKVIKRRNTIYAATLRKAGGKIIGERTITLTGRISRIAWKKYTRKMIDEGVFDTEGTPF